MSSSGNVMKHTTTPIPVSDIWKKRADIGNIVGCVLMLTFATTVLLHPSSPASSSSGTVGGRVILDKEWLNDGFCISHKDVPYRSSFDLCLYLDSVFAILLTILHMKWRRLPGMGMANGYILFYIFGTFGHGIAHGMGGLELRRRISSLDTSDDDDDDMEPKGQISVFNVILQTLIMCVVFWLPLLKATMPKLNWITLVGIGSIVSFILITFVEEKYGFTFVSVLLSIFFSVGQMMLTKEEKGLEYVLLTLLVSVPVIIMGWIEALGCGAFYKAAGGHFIYDGTIVVGLTAFYSICRWNVVAKVKIK